MTFLSPTSPKPLAGSFPSVATMLANAAFETLETRHEPDSKSFWAYMRPGPKPCFTVELLNC